MVVHLYDEDEEHEFGIASDEFRLRSDSDGVVNGIIFFDRKTPITTLPQSLLPLREQKDILIAALVKMLGGAVIINDQELIWAQRYSAQVWRGDLHQTIVKLEGQ